MSCDECTIVLFYFSLLSFHFIFNEERIVETIIRIIKEFIAAKLYGELLIKFESGKIVTIKKTESIKV